MPQISIWPPTRALAKAIAFKRSTAAGRPVKQNEIVHESLLDYATRTAAMTPEEIKEALATASTVRRRAP